MAYYLDLFTAETWKEFRDAGAGISGHSAKKKNIVSKLVQGDILLCYMVGVQRWVGALEVLGSSSDTGRIWARQEFPERLRVRPIVMVDPEYGLPMEELQGKVHFYESAKDKGKFKGFVRMSLNHFREDGDGKLILDMLLASQDKRVHRPIDPKKLTYLPRFAAEIQKGQSTVPITVTVPPPETPPSPSQPTARAEEASASKHTAIQFELLRLGEELGFDVWVARNDRGRAFNGHVLADMPNMIAELPTQFNEATTNTIAYIDVLWLKGNEIVAAFEVESTTSIYSGLLRMSDLLALQPNLKIRLYIVAPEERRDKVVQEILRPTFRIREKPLTDTCGFISFEDLMEKIDGIRKLGLAGALKPEFLDSVAEYFDDDVGD